jgi:hypothetical protein
MSIEAKEFATNILAKLDFSTPQTIKEGITTALVTALSEMATRARLSEDCKKNLQP